MHLSHVIWLVDDIFTQYHKWHELSLFKSEKCDLNKDNSSFNNYRKVKNFLQFPSHLFVDVPMIHNCKTCIV